VGAEATPEDWIKNLLWTRHLERLYLGGSIQGLRVSTLADSSALVTAIYVPETEAQSRRHTQKFSARYTASGELVWAKSSPFGPAPGELYGSLTFFDVSAPQADGSADVVFRGAGPLLIRFEPDTRTARRVDRDSACLAAHRNGERPGPEAWGQCDGGPSSEGSARAVPSRCAAPWAGLEPRSVPWLCHVSRK